MEKEKLKKDIKKYIYDWVAHNFETSEADDPSWDIVALAEHLAEKLATRDYKLTLIVRTDADADDTIDRASKVIEGIGGVVKNIERDRMKRLAYQVEGQTQGYLAHLKCKLPAGKSEQVQNKISKEAGVLRWLLVEKE